MSREHRYRDYGYKVFLGLFVIFCFAYPIAVTGIAFDVHPPFSLAWAASALLFLEGTLLIAAAMLLYGLQRGFYAGLIVIILSYMVEAIGVSTGFPFGAYRYTDVLFPRLPGGVPMAVMFAWVLIVFGAYGWIRFEKRRIGIAGALVGAALATLLDLEIEPVAAHLERYWEWLAPGDFNYYGVPLANFASWFVVAFLLLLFIDVVLCGSRSSITSPPRLVLLTGRILFGTSLFMFGLVDVTHGYYFAAVIGVVAGWTVWALSRIGRTMLLNKLFRQCLL